MKPTFDFPHANGRLYTLAEEVTVIDLQDALDCRFRRLDAMLVMTIGEGGEAFRNFNDSIQESYLHGCSLMVTEIYELFKQLEYRRAL